MVTWDAVKHCLLFEFVFTCNLIREHFIISKKKIEIVFNHGENEITGCYFSVCPPSMHPVGWSKQSSPKGMCELLLILETSILIVFVFYQRSPYLWKYIYHLTKKIEQNGASFKSIPLTSSVVTKGTTIGTKWKIYTLSFHWYPLVVSCMLKWFWCYSLSMLSFFRNVQNAGN